MNEPIITNLRCLNPKCTMTFDYTKSEWENPNLKCYICQTPQHGLWYDCGHVHKSIAEALDCKKEKNIPIEIIFKCLNCKHNQFNSELNSHIYICKNCGLIHEENPPGVFNKGTTKSVQKITMENMNDIWTKAQFETISKMPASKDYINSLPEDEQIYFINENKPINPKDLIGSTKIPLSLIPAPALMDLALALQEGAGKYGPYNWRETPIQITIYIEATIGHLLSLQDGEDIDPDSGLHHAAKAMACCAIILDALHINNIIDNRPTRTKPGAGSFSRNPDKILGVKEKIKNLMIKPWKK